MIPPFAAMDERAGPSEGKRRATAAATLRASAACGVTRMARASGSCSACASRSAAIHSGSPVSEITRISLGPAKKSIAQSAETIAFAAAT